MRFAFLVSVLFCSFAFSEIIPERAKDTIIKVQNLKLRDVEVQDLKEKTKYTGKDCFQLVWTRHSATISSTRVAYSAKPCPKNGKLAKKIKFWLPISKGGNRYIGSGRSLYAMIYKNEISRLCRGKARGFRPCAIKVNNIGSIEYIVFH